MPKRLAAACLIAIALGACSKGGRSQSSAAPAETAGGANMYIANCASCHQPNGEGLAGTFPPLAGSRIVKGDPSKLIRIVKYGITGPLALGGKEYNGMMPAWSPTLSDDAIAATITYVRSSWGNRAAPVTPAQVGAVSK